MNDLEKLEERIIAVEAAFNAIKHAIVVERKMEHFKHPGGNLSNALSEVNGVLEKLKNLKLRYETVGR